MEQSFENNPLLKGMDPEKLKFIMEFANKSKPTNMNDAMPFLMANLTSAKNKNINFSKAEVSLIADILCKNLSEQEKNKVQKIMSMLLH